MTLLTYTLLLLSLPLHALTHRLPANSLDPDYFPPSGIGGLPQQSGGNGFVTIITREPVELRSSFFYSGSVQKFDVPGDNRSAPYEQVVQVKVWGGGGGGCDGGRQMKDTVDTDTTTSSGYSGNYIEASFLLPMGETLLIDVGGGGRSQGSSSHSLGGLGGYNGGKSGYRDRFSGGGGGGGLSKVAFRNGTILVAAYGGGGGGNTTYCTAWGGQGGRLRNVGNEKGFINSEIALVHYEEANDEVAKDEEKIIIPSTPKNEWIQVPGARFESSVHEANTTNTTWCEHSTNMPTGRRGHTMTAINNYVYIFGGATVKCICIETYGAKHCESKNVYSNELWELDVQTSMFTLLETSGNVLPRPREQHSATALPNGEIIIIGGMSSSNEGMSSSNEAIIASELEPLNDVWTFLDPRRVVPYVFKGGNSTLINQYDYLSSTLSADLDDEDIMCVDDLQLSLSLTHDCPEGIEYVSLTSRKHQTKVYVNAAENMEKECSPSPINISFSDTTEESVLSYSGLPNEGVFRPASSLTETFRGLAVNGEWKLDVYHSSKNFEAINGSSLEWDLNIQATPCTTVVKWENLTAPPSFPARHGHTAIAVESSIYIAGGSSGRMLNDLWRVDYPQNIWTELKSVPPSQYKSTLHGRAAALGPMGLLNYGGLGQTHGIQEQESDLFVRTPLFQDNWALVSINSNKNVCPTGRYWSSIALLDSSNEIINKLNNRNDGPFLLMFGGDGGYLPNSYPDSYGFMPNSFFDDIWLLSLSKLNGTDTIYRNAYCIDRLNRDSTRYQGWNNTCGWEEPADIGDETTSEECRIEEILMMAWCKQQYQSFHMI